MNKTWRTRLQLVGGFILILLAAWIVVTGGSGGSGDSAGDGSSSSSVARESNSADGSGGGSTPASNGSTPDSGLDTIAESQLPEEGRETLKLIRSGGPFPYDRDGITFQNREGILPSQSRGYYSEYTVPTPGESDRGARRIIGGDDGDRYYTADHYDSFQQIEEGQ